MSSKNGFLKKPKLIVREGKKYLSLILASEISNYHRDYLGQLIRKGSMPAKKIDGVWFIPESALKEWFTKKASERKNEFDVVKEVELLKKEFLDISSGLEMSSKPETTEAFEPQQALRLPKFPKINLPKFNLNPKQVLFSRKIKSLDPWDVMLLGDPAPEKTQTEFWGVFKTRFGFLSKPLFVKSFASILIVTLAGTFAFKNPDLIFAKYNDLKNIASSSFQNLKSKSEDVKNDLVFALDKTSLALDDSFEKLGTLAFKPSRLNLAQLYNAEFSIPEFSLPSFSYLKNAETLVADFGKYAGRISREYVNTGSFGNLAFEWPSFKFDFKIPDLASDSDLPFESLPSRLGKWAGFLASKGFDKTKEGIADIFNKTFERLARLPEAPKEAEVPTPGGSEIPTRTEPAGEVPSLPRGEVPSEAEGLAILRSQGLEPSVSAPAITEKVVTERVVERVLSGISKNDLDLVLSGINTRILAEVSELKREISTRADQNFQTLSLATRINQISGITLSNVTVSGITNLTDSDIPDDIKISTSNPLSGTSAVFSSTFDVSGESTLATTTISALTVTGIFTASSSGLSLDSTGTTTVAGYIDIAKGLEAGTNKSVIFHESAPASSLVIDSSGNLSSVGALTISNTGTSTISGLLLLTKVPTTAPSFATWAVGEATSSILKSSFLVNPASAGADTVLIAAAVGDSSKFFVDAEGDIFANSLTSVGGQTLSSTTASTLLVENNTTLGDAIGDSVIFNSGLLQFNNRATSTIPNLTVNAWSIATSTSIVPTFTISTASSPFGFVGIGTTSPTESFSTAGRFYVGGTGTSTVENNFSILGTLGVGSGTTYITSSGLNFSTTGSITAGTLGGLSIPYASTTALTVSGSASTTNQVISSLISGRIPYASTAGLLIDNSVLTFDGTRLNATYASSTALTVSNSAYFATTGGNVGIATTSPWGLLSVNPDGLASA